MHTGSFTAAADIETIKSRSITHILTLDICPLPVRITELPFLKTKFIHGKSIIFFPFVLSSRCRCRSSFNCQSSLFLSLSLVEMLAKPVSDTPKDDLLCHFEECFSFIDDAMTNDKAILIHWYVRASVCFFFFTVWHYLSIDECVFAYSQIFPFFLFCVTFSYYGVSRSATIVIAYIMRKYHLSFTRAFER